MAEREGWHVLGLLLFCAGFAALSWEVLWQLQATLSIGLSAQGTALILATTMAGFSLGAWLMGRWLSPTHPRPLRVYAGLEACVGLAGCLLLPALGLVERADGAIFATWPQLAGLVHLVGLALVLGPPTLAMGATIPVLGLLASRHRFPLSRLYGLNTAGAAVGCLTVAFVLIPELGVSGCVLLLATLNFGVAVAAFLGAPQQTGPDPAADEPAEPHVDGLSPRQQGLVVVLTGFATFALEVAWFRSLRAAFQSNTESFALMLAAVLLALSLGAGLVPRLRAGGRSLGTLLAAAGILILLATPLVERFDLVSFPRDYLGGVLARFGLSGLVLGLPIVFLGVPLPWLLEGQGDPRDWSRCYWLNTLGAVTGSLTTAWLLLPALGFARTAWLVGVLVVALGAWLARRPALIVTLGTLAALLAGASESGVGRHRVLGIQAAANIIRYVEGPDSTLSAVQYPSERVLVIDGFVAASQHPILNHYMEMMGRLPMLLHPAPRDALVICFGTGQTANGVRQEGPERLRLVELNRAVLEMGELFPANQGVLRDPRVQPTVMDGRAWMRRTRESYDVITLEPMPPAFAGVNSLYSREFYELARARLKPEGIIAQWLPFHLVSTFDACSIARTFQAVFPNSVLWIDPLGCTGILLGRAGGPPLGSSWPGLERERPRSLRAADFRRALVLDSAGLARYAALGEEITDGNQRLAYGASRRLARSAQNSHHASLAIVLWASTDPPPKTFSSDELIRRLRPVR